MSELLTPRMPSTHSIYLRPPRIIFSSSLCSANARLTVFIGTESALISTSHCPFGSMTILFPPCSSSPDAVDPIDPDPTSVLVVSSFNKLGPEVDFSVTSTISSMSGRVTAESA